MRFAVDFLRLWVRQHERLEWVKEELAPEIAELREIAEAEIAATEKLKARRRFRWGSLAAGAALVIAILLFAPGSPVRVFSASTVAEEVKVVATIPFEDKCGFQTQAPGVTMAMCLDSVEKLTDNTLRFNVHWTASITSGELNAVAWVPGEGDQAPHLEDANGTRYDLIEAGGSAALPLFVRHGEISEAGTFLFPSLEEGSSTVTFVDVDETSGQEIRIEGLVLE